MGKYNRSLARDFGKLLIKDNEEEIKQYLEEERIKEEKDMAWRQRKYELSNSFGEELIFFDDKLDGFYFPEGLAYDVDKFGCLVCLKQDVHLPDNLQNTRGYNHAFVSK